MKKIITNILYPVILLITIFLIWFIASIIIDVELILPSPISSIKSLCFYFTKIELYKNLFMSLIRVFISFILSFIVAFLLSILSYRNYHFKKLISPFISIIRGIPTMSIILILIIWMKPSNASIMVTFIVLMPIIYSNIMSSLMMVDASILEMAKIYNINKKNLIFKIYVPTMYQPLINSASSSISLGLKLVIAAEALSGATDSIGKMMQYEKIWLETSNLFALSILCVVVGFAIEYLVKLLGRIRL